MEKIAHHSLIGQEYCLFRIQFKTLDKVEHRTSLIIWYLLEMLRDAKLTTQGADYYHLLLLKISRVSFNGCCSPLVLLHVLALTGFKNHDSHQKQLLFGRPNRITQNERSSIKKHSEG